jgi:tetratricopeptide (TPR) repeat protein
MWHYRMAASLAVFILLTVGGGCIPADTHTDEEKDPHFQRGRELVSGQDFKGAVEEFEKALETNPRSASAHFELGWLYDTKINDYAAAIYHYEQHLQLQPHSARAQLVQDRIRGCKQQLANSEFPVPNSQYLQKEVDRLAAENVQLRQQLDALRGQATGVPPARSRPVAPPQPVPEPMPAPTPHLEPLATTVAVAGAPHSGRVHIVKARETISSIAREYEMKSSAILAANPGVDPRHLRVGQSLVIP